MENRPMPPKRISILGVGLLGGSIGLAAKRAISGCKIIGYGHRTQTLHAAQSKGAIDEAFTDPRKAVAGCDLVILCTPVGIFAKLLAQIAPALLSDAMVTDVGSTKRSVVDLAQKLLANPARFVGSHPMAGSEKRGVEFARADLLVNHLCLTTPTPQTDPAALEAVESFWQALGMRVSRLTPPEHDRLLADASHLPHAVAAALVAMQTEPGLALAGKGFLDATRIAAGDAALWRDIFLDNRDNLRAAALALGGQLDHLLKLLDAGDDQALKDWLQAAAARRQALEKHRYGP
jgi:prephenate dehydrogenase